MNSRQRPWTLEEDQLLRETAEQKQGDWHEVSRILRFSGYPRRYAADCKSRWRQITKARKSGWDFQHTRQLFRLHGQFGNDWLTIAEMFSQTFQTHCADTLFLNFQTICRSYMKTANRVLQGSIYKRLFSSIPIQTLMCHLLEVLPDDVNEQIYTLRNDDVAAYRELELKLFQFSRQLTTENITTLQKELFDLMNLLRELKIDRSIHIRSKLPPYSVLRKELGGHMDELKHMLMRLAHSTTTREVLPALTICTLPPQPNLYRSNIIKINTVLEEQQEEDVVVKQLLEEQPPIPFWMHTEKVPENQEPPKQNETNWVFMDQVRLGSALRHSSISIQSYGSADNQIQF